jgi:hypothetical protein
MSSVKPLSYDRVKEALRSLGVKRTKKEEEWGGLSFIMDAAAIEGVPHDLDYLIEIRPDDVLHFVVEPHKVVDESKIAAVLVFCNEWNSERLWPNTWIRAFLDEDTGRVCGSHAIDLVTGAHDELIADFLSNSFQASFSLYRELAEAAL